MNDKSDQNLNKGLDSKQKILNAAEEIFGEKGFDGARVDEIARKAGVNKALIYYYFASKEKILEELIDINLKEAIREKELFIKEIKSFDEIDFEEAFKMLSDFLNRKKVFFKIIAMEALKSNPKDMSIFNYLNPILEYSLKRLQEMGIKVEDTTFIRLAAFFFGMIPLSSFYALGEKWAEYYQVDKEEAEKKFLEAYKKIYVEPLMHYLNKNPS